MVASSCDDRFEHARRRQKNCPDYFRELAALVEAAAGGPHDLAAIGIVMLCHGLTPAP